jgi:predicted dienelactone hydrolase
VRPLEALLLIVSLAAFLLLMLPRLRAERVARVLSFAAGAMAGVQILLGGERWQMAPAYAVAVALLVKALAPTVSAPTADSALRRFGRRVIVALGVALIALSWSLPLAFPVFRLSPPTGPYAIGTMTYHWIDADRPEIFTANAQDRRELIVQTWYPAKADASAQRAPYLQDGSVLAPVARLLGLPGWFLTHLKYAMTNAMPSAPMADEPAAFPVLIFSHGRGGVRQHNMFQVEQLVSHGYIVAAIDHPHVASGVDFPDGRRVNYDPRMSDRRFQDRVLPFLAQDVSFTLSQLEAINRSDPSGLLTGRLDLRRAGIFGVSLGGAVAAEACLRDARLRACLPMDVYMPADVVREGLVQPTMWISRDAATMRMEGWANRDIDETQTTMRSVFRRLPGDGYLLLVSGMFHQNLSDFPYYVAPPLDVWAGLDGPIGGARAHAIINAYSLAFFDRYLKDEKAQPLLAQKVADDPAVKLIVRLP